MDEGFSNILINSISTEEYLKKNELPILLNHVELDDYFKTDLRFPLLTSEGVLDLIKQVSDKYLTIAIHGLTHASIDMLCQIVYNLKFEDITNLNTLKDCNDLCIREINKINEMLQVNSYIEKINKALIHDLLIKCRIVLKQVYHNVKFAVRISNGNFYYNKKIHLK